MFKSAKRNKLPEATVLMFFQHCKTLGRSPKQPPVIIHPMTSPCHDVPIVGLKIFTYIILYTSPVYPHYIPSISPYMTTYDIIDIIDILKFVLRDISIISDIMFWFYHTLPFQGVPPENYRPWWSLEKSPSSPSQPTHVFPIKKNVFFHRNPMFFA